MVMMLKQFHDLKHDVVAKASVHRYDEHPRFVILSLDHVPPSAMAHGRRAKKLAVLLTQGQARTLAAQLARSAPESHPKPSAAGSHGAARARHR